VSRRALQIASALLGVIPVVTGALTMMGLADPIYAAAGLPMHALLDRNLRFLGGLATHTIGVDSWAFEKL
jgi:hypothetical protein